MCSLCVHHVYKSKMIEDGIAGNFGGRRRRFTVPQATKNFGSPSAPPPAEFGHCVVVSSIILLDLVIVLNNLGTFLLEWSFVVDLCMTSITD